MDEDDYKKAKEIEEKAKRKNLAKKIAPCQTLQKSISQGISPTLRKEYKL